MNATPVIQTQQESVRLLALQHDLKTVSELTGVPYDLVRQWESRRKRRALKAAGVTMSQTPVKRIADNVQDELAENERETRLSLSKASRRMAKDCEELPAREANTALTVAKTASLVHGWGNEKGQAGFSLNVLNLGQLQIGIKTDSTDEPTS